LAGTPGEHTPAQSGTASPDKVGSKRDEDPPSPNKRISFADNHSKTASKRDDASLNGSQRDAVDEKGSVITLGNIGRRSISSVTTGGKDPGDDRVQADKDADASHGSHASSRSHDLGGFEADLGDKDGESSVISEASDGWGPWIEKPVKIFVEGDTLGEIAAIKAGCRAIATLRARTNCELCTLSSKAVEELSETFPQLEAELMISAARADYSLCAFLATTVLFAEAGVELISAVSTKLQRIKCEPGEQLITLGTASKGLFVVYSGCCDCLITDPEDPSARRNVATKMPGEVFGELSLLEPQKKTAADVVAGEGTEVLLLTPDNYTELQLDHVEFRRLLVSTMPSYATYNFFFELPLFRNATHEFIEELSRLTKQENHQAGATLQHASKAAGGACFVQKGQLSADADGLKPMALHEGMVFGLETILEREACWTVIAQTDVQLWRLAEEDCKALVSAYEFLFAEAEADFSKSMLEAGAADLDKKPDLSLEVDLGAADAGAEMSLTGGPAVMSAPLNQRLLVIQSSIVSMNREFGGLIKGLEAKVFEHIEQNDRRRQKTLDLLLERVQAMTDASDHPQRGPRANSRVSFAKRGGGGSGDGGGRRSNQYPIVREE